MAGIAVIPQEKCQSCELVSTWNYFEWYYEDTFLQFFYTLVISKSIQTDTTVTDVE